MAKKKSPPPSTKRAKVTYPTPVEHVKHRDKRVNIPTEELRDFVAEDETAPKKMLYPRDPSLDPQLVWKGKDEQDAKPLEVPVVPIYIQEKIHPQAIIEDVRAQARKEKPEDQIGLFADFNGIQFEEMIDFYRHEQNWTNRMILGDSLLVMTSLSEKEGLKGKVQSIYFDPPYGIKFGSNWQVSTRKRDVKDGKVEDATRQPEQVKAFRDTWKLGIHSYLSYLRDRFVVCRDLLTESGSLFVQIGDENVHLVRSVLEEVFGSENIIGTIGFIKTTAKGSAILDSITDSILWFAKNKEVVKYRQLYLEKELGGERMNSYVWIDQKEIGNRRKLSSNELSSRSTPENAMVFSLQNMTSQSGGESSRFPVRLNGIEFIPKKNFWKTNPIGMDRLVKADRLMISGQNINYVRYLVDFSRLPVTNIWMDTAIQPAAAAQRHMLPSNGAGAGSRLIPHVLPWRLHARGSCRPSSRTITSQTQAKAL
jgi:adenine-specific DNA-methyltransferase